MSDDSSKNTIADQPPPVASDGPAVWDLVIADMRERDRVGRERYGTPLRANNGRNALVDAYQESLDLAVYLRQRIAEDRAADSEREGLRQALAIVKADRDKWAAIARERHALRDEVNALRTELADRERTDARSHRGEFTIGCGFHAGAEITVCGCPPIDSPGAHAYRGLLVAACAEIDRLNAELAAARAVTPDVEAAIKAHDEAAQAEGAALALHRLPSGCEGTYADYRRACSDTEGAAEDLRAAIARATATAAAEARHAASKSAEAHSMPPRHGKTAMARAIEQARDDIEDHKASIAILVGDVDKWHGMATAANSALGELCDRFGVERPRHGDDWPARVVEAIKAARLPTVGELLGSSPVGTILECPREGEGRYAQVKICNGELEARAWSDGHAWAWMPRRSFDVDMLRLPARIVDAAEADKDPATRGPIVQEADARAEKRAKDREEFDRLAAHLADATGQMACPAALTVAEAQVDPRVLCGSHAFAFTSCHGPNVAIRYGGGEVDTANGPDVVEREWWFASCDETSMNVDLSDGWAVLSWPIAADDLVRPARLVEVTGKATSADGEG